MQVQAPWVRLGHMARGLRASMWSTVSLQEAADPAGERCRSGAVSRAQRALGLWRGGGFGSVLADSATRPGLHQHRPDAVYPGEMIARPVIR